MKEGFRKIASVLMAIMVLASTLSWTVEKHYCMGHVIDVAFFGEAQDCGMMMSLDEDSALELSCCSKEVISVDGQDDLKHQVFQLDFEQEVILFAFTFTYLHLSERLEEQVIPHKEYPPPLLIEDIQVLHEVFLI